MQPVYRVGTIALTHLQAILLFAFFTSLVFAFLSRKTLNERLKYLLWAFLGFVLVAMALGWLMYPFPW